LIHVPSTILRVPAPNGEFVGEKARTFGSGVKSVPRSHLIQQNNKDIYHVNRLSTTTGAIVIMQHRYHLTVQLCHQPINCTKSPWSTESMKESIFHIKVTVWHDVAILILAHPLGDVVEPTCVERVPGLVALDIEENLDAERYYSI
jgi:hypothetical protein